MSKERNEAEALCSGVPEKIRPYAVELALNVIFQCAKLAETRKAMEKNRSQLIVAYNNGGGQSGIRKNPVYEAYNQLMANYRKSLAQLVELLQTYGMEDVKSDDSPLSRILAAAAEMA